MDHPDLAPLQHHQRSTGPQDPPVQGGMTGAEAPLLDQGRRTGTMAHPDLAPPLLQRDAGHQSLPGHQRMTGSLTSRRGGVTRTLTGRGSKGRILGRGGGEKRRAGHHASEDDREQVLDDKEEAQGARDEEDVRSKWTREHMENTMMRGSRRKGTKRKALRGQEPGQQTLLGWVVKGTGSTLGARVDPRSPRVLPGGGHVARESAKEEDYGQQTDRGGDHVTRPKEGGQEDTGPSISRAPGQSTGTQ